ncbi:alpha-galactosidase [Trifolium medium]|uniref:Alpha-galactosidase n=1 Tax=Trifolium medium TaxID=97028 RepID=A0A392PP43_9FABA|nr:alpha-galactosidase [Trifolium medium]
MFYVGEVYVAFFNLSEQKAVISAQTSDLAKVLPGRDSSSCKGSEVWSGSDIVITQGTLSAEVEMHGTALFVLNCN